jgi:hypothetical protein
MKWSRREWLKMGAIGTAGLLPGIGKAAEGSERALKSGLVASQQKWGMGVPPGQNLPPEATDGPWKNLRAVKEKKVFDMHCHCYETPLQGHNYKDEGHMHDLDKWQDYTNELIASMDAHGIAQAAMNPAFEVYETIVQTSITPHLDRFIRSSGMPTIATKGNGSANEGTQGRELTPEIVAEVYRTHIERDKCIIIGETSGNSMMSLQRRYSVKDLKPMADVVIEHDVPVQIHTGWTATGTASNFGRGYMTAWHWAENMGNLMTAYPDIKFIMAHTGGALATPDDWEAIRLLFSFDNAYIDTAKTPPEIVAEAVRGVGAERVLFGSDWNRPQMKEYGPYHMRAVYQHWWNLNTIANADLTEDQRDWVLYKSSRKLLKLPEA